MAGFIALPLLDAEVMQQCSSTVDKSPNSDSVKANPLTESLICRWPKEKGSLWVKTAPFSLTIQNSEIWSKKTT
ncbi:MAG: hypothetical protein J6A42_07905 [Firmicutes bacterium]|nr:hypothetical protein [Bacillota bacterium]